MELVNIGIFWWILLTAILIVIVAITVKLFVQHLKQQQIEDKRLYNIVYLGGLAFLSGMLSQIIGIITAINAIIEAADISFEIVISGFKRSFYLPAYGLILFIVSIVFTLIIRKLQINRTTGT